MLAVQQQVKLHSAPAAEVIIPLDLGIHAWLGVWAHNYQAAESHPDCVYMIIGIQSARVMIRRINPITIIIILLSDKLAVLTNAPRGVARGKMTKCKMPKCLSEEWFRRCDQIKTTLLVMPGVHTHTRTHTHTHTHTHRHRARSA